jgi:hypothetical protein
MAEDAKRSAPIRADAIPTDGYILTVDGKLKTRYETEQDVGSDGHPDIISLHAFFGATSRFRLLSLEANNGS